MERRLAAILAADVVGYSRLMGEDEVGTLERLKSLRKDIVQPSIRERKGRVVKLMGDGLLAEFPSVVEAVQCAVEIQEQITERETDAADGHRIRLRIGVNLGDIIVEGSDIYGDGVNVAARLEGVSEPGGICLSGPARDTLSNKLNYDFEDCGEQVLKNIDQPVRVWRWPAGGTTNAETGNAPRAVPQHSDQPTVAVIPFSNLSSDQELDFLADGLAEDIIALIAKTPGFLVIGRYSTLTYKAGRTDVRKIGRELGARYVVQGTIRPIGDRLRISVELIEAESGNQIWSERFDRQTEDLFNLQDEVSAGIVASLHPEITRAEVELVERYRPKDINAWTLYRQGGTALFRRGFNKRGFEEGAQFYRKAIELDPDFALAHAALSLTLAIGHILGFVPEADEAAAEAECALELTSSDSEVLGFAGCAIADLGDAERGIDILERAIELNPSNPQAWTALGGALLSKRQYGQAVEKLKQGIRISPRDPRLAVWGSMLALALGAQGLNDEGIAEARAACRRDQKLHNPRVVLASLLLRSGQQKEAIAALADARRIDPELNQRAVAGLVGKRAAKELAEIWSEVI